MIRTQIQLTAEQARGLKRIAAREKKSMAELIRLSVDALITSSGVKSQEELCAKAIAAAGQLHGPENLSADHDDYLTQAFK
jgi:hypothetical protein